MLVWFVATVTVQISYYMSNEDSLIYRYVMDFCFTQNMIYSKGIAMTAEDISLYHFHSLVLSFSIFVFCLPLTVSCVPSTHQRVRAMCGEVSDVRPLFKVLSVASEVCNINQHSPEVLLHPFLSLQ